ncbi:PREDICTED: uncharacterized protein LOC105508051 [Colobus angolensis palliatus]|uniref:uncharacterized protein LOC105508051 n=1 Tax=Colobus angolensis palliatus TaxID=336983 RepID=UPI0005F506DF|nr:PREDICTED: uncharacterized protein LOC105508051 [Colobus angolensis palliatus]
MQPGPWASERVVGGCEEACLHLLLAPLGARGTQKGASPACLILFPPRLHFKHCGTSEQGGPCVKPCFPSQHSRVLRWSCPCPQFLKHQLPAPPSSAWGSQGASALISDQQNPPRDQWWPLSRPSQQLSLWLLRPWFPRGLGGSLIATRGAVQLPLPATSRGPGCHHWRLQGPRGHHRVYREQTGAEQRRGLLSLCVCPPSPHRCSRPLSTQTQAWVPQTYWKAAPAYQDNPCKPHSRPHHPRRGEKAAARLCLCRPHLSGAVLGPVFPGWWSPVLTGLWPWGPHSAVCPSPCRLLGKAGSPVPCLPLSGNLGPLSSLPAQRTLTLGQRCGPRSMLGTRAGSVPESGATRGPGAGEGGVR